MPRVNSAHINIWRVIAAAPHMTQDFATVAAVEPKMTINNNAGIDERSFPESPSLI